MEKALRFELNAIPEINNKIFPTNAPEGQNAPYLVYITRKTPGKNLDGTTQDRTCFVMLNALCNSYSEMKELTEKVEGIVKTFALRSIGETGPYIQDLTFDETTETYENELKLYRGIIPFKICYEEE